MAEDDPVVLPTIYYYLRTGYYGLAENFSNGSLQQYCNDTILKFYRSYAMIMQDRVQEAIRELETLKDKRDVNLCSFMALILAHKKSRNIDKEAVNNYEQRLKDERRQAGELGLYYAGFFLFQLGKPEKAREYNDRMLKINPQSRQGLVLKGWISLTSGKDVLSKKSIKFFDEAMELEGSALDLNLLLGKSKHFEMRHNFRGALDILNQIIVTFPKFIPAFIENMRLQLALLDWQQCFEYAQRTLEIDSHCIEGLRYSALYSICKEGNFSEAGTKLGEIIRILDQFESHNSELYKDFSQLFSCLCGRNGTILQKTTLMIERCIALAPRDVDALTGLAALFLMRGKSQDALTCYKNAMDVDETSVVALTGIIRCQILGQKYKEAAQQLEFLNELQTTMGKSAELSYLSTLMSIHKQENREIIIQNFAATIEAHFVGLKGTPMGTEYLRLLNPEFLLTVVKDFLKFAPQQPCSPGKGLDPVLKKCMQALDPVNKALSGLKEASFLMAKVKFLAGDLDSAQAALKSCLDDNPSFTEAYILMAQIHLHRKNIKLANQALEVGLSYNFEVRNHPLYHLIKASVDKLQKNYDDALKTLQIALSLPGIKISSDKSAPNVEIDLSDRVSVFLELAQVHMLLGQQHEAARVIETAIQEFKGTNEEVRVNLANADLALMRGDVDGAIDMLRSITSTQPYYVQAREKMADIYLNHKKDKHLYTSCYRELVDKQPSTQTCLLLGNAYMKVLEPDHAIEVYENALKKNPHDSTLASKIGQAYVVSHNYGKAISYYEAALKTGGPSLLRRDLAELLLNLQQYTKAEKVIRQAFDIEGPPTDLEAIIDHAEYYLLLYKVFDQLDKTEDATLALSKARDLHLKILKRVQVEQPDKVSTQKAFAVRIFSHMAEHAMKQKDYANAVKHYKEAMFHDELNYEVRLKLAKLYLETEDLDSCQHELFLIIQADKDNNSALFMLADLMFTRNNFDEAAQHYEKLLEINPDNYEALSRLCDVKRRSGSLEDFTKFLTRAENSSAHSTFDAGFNYCKGLYYWYSGNLNEALHHFNKARRDNHWGTPSLLKMINICLNPDSDNTGGGMFDEEVDNEYNQKEHIDNEAMSLRTAEKLIYEIKLDGTSLDQSILLNRHLIASKNKQKIEVALESLLEILSKKESISCLHGLAVGYMMLKQTQRARNQLKKVMKHSWNIKDADELESCWLLLAHVYIQSAKYDTAMEFLKKCLQYNKSCWKAHDFMGYMMEKDQAHKDAVAHYENAWIYSQKNNPTIGYKLAFNYMKSKRYMDAIDVCHHVLKRNPDYPKIRKDILDKSRLNLRP